MSDRENGFLTDRDKTFLRANADGDDYYTSENAKNQRYETREVIAERARQAFHDFAFLFEVLDERERDRIFDPPENEAKNLKFSLRDTIGFLYLSLEGRMDNRSVPKDRSLKTNFNQIFKPGIKNGEYARLPESEKNRNLGAGDYGYVTYDDFEVEYVSNPPIPDVDEIVERLAESGTRDVTDKEIQRVVESAVRGHRMPIMSRGEDPPAIQRMDLYDLAERIDEQLNAKDENDRDDENG